MQQRTKPDVLLQVEYSKNVLIAFSIILLVAVLLSSIADRTILSTSGLFLLSGILLGNGVLKIIPVTPTDPMVAQIAELALFAVLYTDGMKAGWRDIRRAWRLPGRALLLGLPLTLLITAVLAHYLLHLPWTVALLIGAILSPTDPVFASALVGNDKVPARIRYLLNVESGVNDGLALPFVIILLTTAENQHAQVSEVALEIILGIAIGIIIPIFALRLEKTKLLEASHIYEPLTGFAIGIIVLALGKATHGNLFLASFTAGITVASYGPAQRKSFEQFGELLAELLKLAALLVFGALITSSILRDIGWIGTLFAFLAIFLPRPLALAASFIRSGLSAREQIAAAWFGPKGFASVVYALLVLSSAMPGKQIVFDIIAATVVLSIFLHSSTDVVIAKWFDDYSETPTWHGHLPHL